MASMAHLTKLCCSVILTGYIPRQKTLSGSMSTLKWSLHVAVGRVEFRKTLTKNVGLLARVTARGQCVRFVTTILPES